MIRLLIVCDINSVWIRNLVDQLDTTKISISIASTAPPHAGFIEEMEHRGIKLDNGLLEIRKAKNERHFLKCIYLDWKYITLISSEYDVINLQYVTMVIFLMLGIRRKSRKKMVLSYWGSDLLVKPIPAGLKRLVQSVAYVTFDNNDLKEKFRCLYGSIIPPDAVVMLPLPILDLIREEAVKPVKENAIDGHLLPVDKTIISVGYNRRTTQQHKNVLEQLTRLPEDYKKKMTILLQCTYGVCRDGYIGELKDIMEQNGLSYIIFEDFLSDEDVAKIRMATDIYINAQQTDAFAGSVCEYLYAGTVLVNAKWLHYKEFDMYDFDYYEFEQFDGLNQVVRDVMDNRRRIDTEKNRKLVYELRSTQVCKKAWNKVYEELCG